MYSLLFNDDSNSSDSDFETTTTNRNRIVPVPVPVPVYCSVFLTRSGVAKLKKGKDIFELPLTDLRDPPHLSNIYTIGDLIRFIDKNIYIKNAIEEHFTTTIEPKINDTDTITDQYDY